MNWAQATVAYCQDDTVSVRFHVKVLYLQYEWMPFLGSASMVNYDFGTSPLVRIAPLNARYISFVRGVESFVNEFSQELFLEMAFDFSSNFYSATVN